MISLNEVIHKNTLKNKATSNINIQNFLSFLTLIDVRTYLRDSPVKCDIGIVTLHPFQGTHWVLYIHKG